MSLTVKRNMNKGHSNNGGDCNPGIPTSRLYLSLSFTDKKQQISPPLPYLSTNQNPYICEVEEIEGIIRRRRRRRRTPNNKKGVDEQKQQRRLNKALTLDFSCSHVQMHSPLAAVKQCCVDSPKFLVYFSIVTLALHLLPLSIYLSSSINLHSLSLSQSWHMSSFFFPALSLFLISSSLLLFLSPYLCFTLLSRVQAQFVINPFKLLIPHKPLFLSIPYCEFWVLCRRPNLLAINRAS